MGKLSHAAQPLLRTAGRRAGQRVPPPLALALLVAIGAGGCTSGARLHGDQPALGAATPVDALAAPIAGGGGTTVALRGDRPREYVVVKGDTLWDISARFLADPFQWPRVWKNNPQIKNPHLIYPGDRVRLRFVDGEPVFDVLRPGEIGAGDGDLGPRGGRERLSPRIHESELVHSVSRSAAAAIADFIRSPHVLSNEQLADAAYVLATEEDRQLAADRDRVYARGFGAELADVYSVFVPTQPLIDLDTGEVLGREARRVADATIERDGDPAVMRLFATTQETRAGDLLIAKPEEAIEPPQPVAIEPHVQARLISLYDSLAYAGQYQVIVINKGRADNIPVGAIMEIVATGRTVIDTRARHGAGELVQLPEERHGVAMVFRTFERVSYALIIEAERAIKVGDTLRGF